MPYSNFKIHQWYLIIPVTWESGHALGPWTLSSLNLSKQSQSIESHIIVVRNAHGLQRINGGPWKLKRQKQRRRPKKWRPKQQRYPILDHLIFCPDIAISNLELQGRKRTLRTEYKPDKLVNTVNAGWMCVMVYITSHWLLIFLL